MDQTMGASRRKLLINLGMGGVGLAATSWAGPLSAFAASSPLGAALGSLKLSELQQWSAAVGTSFNVLGEAGARAMTLIAAKALPVSGVRPAGLRPQPFTLTFETTAGARAPAGNQIYVFQQSNGNQLQLFVGGRIMVGTKAQLVAVLN
jgi:hypothetical protein